MSRRRGRDIEEFERANEQAKTNEQAERTNKPKRNEPTSQQADERRLFGEADGYFGGRDKRASHYTP
jgi:hypothetical protein